MHLRGGREDQFGQKDGKESKGKFFLIPVERLTPEPVRQQTATGSPKNTTSKTKYDLGVGFNIIFTRLSCLDISIGSPY